MTESKAPAPNVAGTGTGTSDQTDTATVVDTGLSVPDSDADVDTLAAALAYARCGWYVLPVRRGSKHPGSVVGAQWQRQSSRDPQQIVAWFAAEDHGIALHCGRSGAAVFDVDHPDQLPEVLAGHLADAPFQSTRTDTPGRGHYVFATPPRRTIGNSTGRLGGAWGEVRGLNGVILAAPTMHPEGGEYRWQRVGPVPVLPDALAVLLDDASPAEDAATDAQVRAFITGHTEATRPEVLAGLTKKLAARYAAGESRHQSTLPAAAGAMKEARAGLYPAQDAANVIRAMFLDAVAQPPAPGSGQKAARTGQAAEAEWAGILSWAVGQALAADPAETRARVEDKMPGNFWGTGASPAVGRLEQVTDQPPPDNGQAGSDAATGRGRSIEPVSLADARDVFRRWLGDDYDIDALDAVLVTAAVEALDGDPLWLLLISGSGNAKTETVQCLDGIGAVVTATITEGGLLSATPRKERAKDATGGLLRKLEPRGVLVIKDVTSILSMNSETRAQVLGALREVYDGRWSRNVGTDGGRTLEWAGRIAVVGAVTTAWDKAHSVIASMGDRFVLIRMDSTAGRIAAGRKAIGNTGSEVEMRAELAAAAAGVLAGMNPDPVTLTDAETEVLLAAADLVTLARTGVEYDYRGDVTDAHAPEMPTRFAKQLAQIVRGGVAIGMDRLAAMRLAIRAARDSVPPLRLAIIDDVAKYPNSSTADVRRRIDKPRATVDRQLQALHMLGVLECDEADGMHRGKPVTLWYYRLAENIEPGALDPTVLADSDSVPDLPPPSPNPNKERAGESGRVPSTLQPLSGKSGTALGAAAPTPCVHCGEPVVAGQRDDTGRPAHLSCRQTFNGG